MDAFNGIKEGASNAWNTAKEVGGAAWDVTTAGAKAVYAGGKETVSSILDGQSIQTSISDGISAGKTSLNTSGQDIKQHISNAKGDVGSLLRIVSDSTFVGIDTNNIGTVTDAITQLQNNINDTINGFNPDASLENAVKGDVSTALSEYLVEIKSLLNAYVQTLDINKTELQTAVTRYQENAQQNARNIEQARSDVTSNAASVRSMASDIKLN